MNVPKANSPQAVMERLNKTPLSLHLLHLFQAAKTTPEPGLLVVAMIFWLVKNPGDLDPGPLQEWAGVAAGAEQDDLEATYNNLADPELAQAKTLKQAGARMATVLASLSQD